jgi:hypothetical protein
MKVKELIALLQTVNPEGRVFHGYDGDIVVTESGAVEEITNEKQIGDCWLSVKVGDVVILEA